MNQKFILRLQFHLAIGLTGLGIWGIIIFTRLGLYANFWFVTSIILTIVGLFLTIRDGKKFFTYLKNNGIECNHYSYWRKQNGNKVCAKCGNEF